MTFDQKSYAPLQGITTTVEPLIVDPPRKGHRMLDLSTRYKPAEFILVPKCPLFRGSTVLLLFADVECALSRATIGHDLKPASQSDTDVQHTCLIQYVKFRE